MSGQCRNSLTRRRDGLSVIRQTSAVVLLSRSQITDTRYLIRRPEPSYYLRRSVLRIFQPYFGQRQPIPYKVILSLWHCYSLLHVELSCRRSLTFVLRWVVDIPPARSIPAQCRGGRALKQSVGSLDSLSAGFMLTYRGSYKLMDIIFAYRQDWRTVCKQSRGLTVTTFGQP